MTPTKEEEDLIAWVSRSRADDWEAILSHRAANEILIEFRFDGLTGHQHRVYEVRRAPANAYASAVSGGQEQWTDKGSGPNGEEVTCRREWVVSERGGYIGSFESLQMLAVMILHNLRGGSVYVVSDSAMLPLMKRSC